MRTDDLNRIIHLIHLTWSNLQKNYSNYVVVERNDCSDVITFDDILKVFFLRDDRLQRKSPS